MESPRAHAPLAVLRTRSGRNQSLGCSSSCSTVNGQVIARRAEADSACQQANDIGRLLVSELLHHRDKEHRRHDGGSLHSHKPRCCRLRRSERAAIRLSAALREIPLRNADIRHLSCQHEYVG